MAEPAHPMFSLVGLAGQVVLVTGAGTICAAVMIDCGLTACDG